MISDIELEDYNYFLPDKQIAYYPLSTRSDSRLLYVNRAKNSIEHHKFYEIDKLLPDETLLVRNTTKVIPARLYFRKPGGGRIELFLLKPIEPSVIPQIAMQAKSTCTWECMVGGRGVAESTSLNADKMSFDYELKAKILCKNEKTADICFEWNNPKFNFSHILMHHGHIPLPPYIKRVVEPNDSERYQTVYANADGSVAAPTAGLHFSDDVIHTLQNRGIQFCDLTLHVGTGTFLPISDNNVNSHQMHSEKFYVELQELKKIQSAINSKKPIIAVGTTSVRTIESIYWYASNLKSFDNANLENIRIEQWLPYKSLIDNDVYDVFDNLINNIESRGLDYISGETSLFIVPGYKFNVISGMLTNFHQPKSTLILLVAAFLGKDLWKKSYDIALQQGYRFLSYGDSSLLL